MSGREGMICSGGSECCPGGSECYEMNVIREEVTVVRKGGNDMFGRK